MSDKEAIKVLIAHRIRFMDDFGWDKTTIEALDIAIASLATESKPVVKGEWKISFLYQYAVGYKCSCCDYFQLHRTRFCPNCGAEMEGRHE